MRKNKKKFIILASILAFLVAFLVFFIRFYGCFKAFFNAICDIFHRKELEKRKNDEFEEKDSIKLPPEAIFDDLNEEIDVDDSENRSQGKFKSLNEWIAEKQAEIDKLDSDFYENLGRDEKKEVNEALSCNMVGKYVRINDYHSLYFGRIGQITEKVYDSFVCLTEFKVKFEGITCQPFFRPDQFDILDEN